MKRLLSIPPTSMANLDETCAGNHIKLSVEPNGKRYAVAVPFTKHEQTYDTKQ